ncbi:MAG TPA: cation:proton antiporter [Acidimicrobiia bacterium]|nr:cation:proton antiporter [Acidimicrobiia bacterium]
MHGELLALLLVVVAALVGGRLAIRLGYPSILGELVAGMILGPPVLGLVSGSETLTILGEFGVLLMMLYIGMHLNLGDLRKASKPGLLAAVGGFVVPAGLGYALMDFAGFTPLESLFVGLAMGVTSLATKSRILVDLRILDTRLAYVLMAAALISDLTVLVVFAAVVGPEGAAGSATFSTAAVAGLKAIAFGLVAGLVGLRLVPRFATFLARLERGTAFLTVVATGVLFGWAAELAGLHSILGAFVAGLFLSEQAMGIRLSRDVQRMLSTVSVGTLAPIFFVTAGFQVSFSVFRTDLWLVLAVIVVATLGKVFGTTIFYLIGRQPWREGMVVGAGMNGRGAVEIIVAEIALVAGIIDQDVFSILVFMAIITTALVPIMLTKGVDWLRQRGELVKAGDREGAIIVGAGPVARELGQVLSKTEPVTLVDTNRANLEAVRQLGMKPIFGSALEEQTLLTAGVERAATLIALTPNNEVNVLTAQLASGHGVPAVAVLVRDAEASSFESLLDDNGVSRLFPGELDLLTWDYELASGAASRQEIEVPPEGIDNLTRATQDVLPLAVVRTGDIYPFTGDIEPGDRVILISTQRARAGAEV